MKPGREIFAARYRRCQRTGRKEKGNILDEVAGTGELNRDHPAYVVTSYGKRQPDKGEARPGRRKRGSVGEDRPGIRTKGWWPY
jgi:hypothetical protein